MAHYERMPQTDIRKNLEIAIIRLVEADTYAEEVLRKVVTEMADEGFSLAKILAHLDMVDLDNRI
jgi:hypothetical protein